MSRTLITVRQASSITGLAEKTIYNYKGGTETLTRIHLGRSVRLFLDEIEALIKKQSRKIS